MSQVRKLLKGEIIPKAENGYKFHLDSQDYVVTDDQLKEIDNRISALDPNHRRFLGNWTNAIKTGESSGNRASNTVTLNMISGVGKRDLERLKKQKGSFWETFADKDSYYAKEAIGEALSITASVLNSGASAKEKTKVAKTDISLDFNEKDGKKYLSPTGNYSAKKRVSDILAHLQAGDNSEYDYSAYDLDAISAWLNSQEGDDKYKGASDYFDNLWANMSKAGYEYDPDTEDLLKLFAIKYNFAVPTKPTTVITPITTPTTPSTETKASGTASTYKIGDIVNFGDKTYKITGVDTNGKIIIEEITDVEKPEEIDSQVQIKEQSEQPEEPQTESTPKLILIKPGDRDDMDWGVYYNGVPYAYESILPGSDLGNLMANFERNNRQMWTQGKRYNENSFIKTPSIKNFTDWTIGQTFADGTNLNQFFLNRGIVSAALSHMFTDAEGNRYFKYYNNFNPTGTYIPREGNVPKETPWGIRSPYYLMIDKNGNITSIDSEPEINPETDSVINQAPKIKDLWDPTGSINILTPYDNSYKTSSNSVLNGTVPATFLGNIKLGKNECKLYKLQDGRYFLDGPGYTKDTFITTEQLARMIKKGKMRLKSGGTISKSKTDAFKNKFQDVVKGQEGLRFAMGKLPQDVEFTTEGGDPTKIIITDEDGNVLIVNRTVENAIPEEIASTVARPINEEMHLSETTDNAASTETSEKVTTPKVSNRAINELKHAQYQPNKYVAKNKEEKRSFIVPTVPLAKQKIFTLNAGKKSSLDDLVAVLEQLAGYKKGGVLKAQNGTTVTQNEEDSIQDNGGGFVNNISGVYKYLIPGLSLARFALNSHFQKKYHDQSIAALNAGRFNEIAAWANIPRQDSPALDRQLQQIRSERMAGIKPVTSDLIANNALQNERESKLYDRENDVIGKQSQFEWNAAKEALDVMNHNIANQVAVANSNRARTAAINSAIKQQDMELTQRRAQSWENLGLEIQNNLKKDKDVILNYNKTQEQIRLQKEYDKTLDNIFGAKARNDYNSLGATEAANYTDYEDYLSQKYPDLYRSRIKDITAAQEARISNMRKWLYLNGLNYSYPSFITGKTSTYGYKKGGYLRGSTRYTLEPEERIWIDNNKATHQAIAKLSDNTIKLLLRALK